MATDEAPWPGQALADLEDAIVELGGELSDAQRKKFDAVVGIYRGALKGLPLPPEPARREQRPGRNEPCWCGSGQKYKKCHLSDDSGRGR
ncbi:SEC-C domain-containing protein [Myxococcus sp. RHST-1-4]|nr:SEC-C domain-containing protein [Myxococcus sp. RHSTA-1-4]